MVLSRRLLLLKGSIAALALPIVAAEARPQPYPSHPIRILVGFPAGGPVDIAGRVIAPWLSDRLGQSVEVVNRPGDSGNIATREAIRAPADGHTLLVCGPVNTINTTLFADLDFDFARDTAAIASLSRVPLLVEVNPAVPVKTAAEFIAYARAHPGRLRVAYAGNGTPQHIGIELFRKMAGLDLTLVPYLGSAPALADLLAGKVDAMFDPLPSSIGHVRAGRLVPLAVTTPTRVEALADVPAMADFVPGYEAGSWFGLVAPAGTPVSIIDRLNREVNAALDTPAIRTQFSAIGATTLPGSPSAFASFIAHETRRYADIIREARITITR